MKVLVLANFGMGLYKFRKELLEKMVNDGYQVTVSFPKDEYSELIEDLGCKFVSTDVDRRGKNPFNDLKLLKNYFELLREIKPNVVLTYTIKPNIYGGIMSSILKYPYLPNITGTGSAIQEGGLLSKLSLNLYKVGIRKASGVFFQNKDNLDFFIKKGIVSQENSIQLPGSGVNITDYDYLPYPMKDSEIRILYIGRILRSKGINELLEAITIIKEKHKNVKFDIVGFCDEDYEKKLKEYENDNMLTFHGQQSDVIPYIKKSHAVVLPSYHEGMSNVLLESAASGRPLLASNVPGCQETFDEGVSGFGFEAMDTTSLVEAIDKFIELPYEEKRKMGINGKKKIENEFNRQIIIDAYSEMISSIKGE